MMTEVVQHQEAFDQDFEIDNTDLTQAEDETNARMELTQQAKEEEEEETTTEIATALESSEAGAAMHHPQQTQALVAHAAPVASNYQELERMLCVAASKQMQMALSNSAAINQMTNALSVVHSEVKTLSTELQDLKKGSQQEATRLLGEVRKETETIREELTAKFNAQKEEVAVVNDVHELRLVLEFLVRFGMDTTNGYVAAFPVHLCGSLRVAISLSLLTLGMTRLFTRTTKKYKLTQINVLKLLIRLQTVAVDSDELHKVLTPLFAVRPYAKGKRVEDGWVVLDARYFVRVIAQVTACPPTLTAPEKAIKSLKYSPSKYVMWSQESMKGANAYDYPNKMAWAFQLQKEVLSLPSVAEFFALVPCASESKEEEEKKTVFHFRGLECVFDVDVLSHAELLKRVAPTVCDGEEEDEASKNEEGEEEEEEEEEYEEEYEEESQKVAKKSKKRSRSTLGKKKRDSSSSSKKRRSSKKKTVTDEDEEEEGGKPEHGVVDDEADADTLTVAAAVSMEA